MAAPDQEILDRRGEAAFATLRIGMCGAPEARRGIAEIAGRETRDHRVDAGGQLRRTHAQRLEDALRQEARPASSSTGVRRSARAAESWCCCRGKELENIIEEELQKDESEMDPDLIEYCLYYISKAETDGGKEKKSDIAGNDKIA